MRSGQYRGSQGGAVLTFHISQNALHSLPSTFYQFRKDDIMPQLNRILKLYVVVRGVFLFQPLVFFTYNPLFHSLMLLFPPQKSAVLSSLLLKDATIGIDVQYKFINCPLNQRTNLNKEWSFFGGEGVQGLKQGTSLKSNFLPSHYLALRVLHDMSAPFLLSQAFSIVIGMNPTLQLSPLHCGGNWKHLPQITALHNNKIGLLSTKERHP